MELICNAFLKQHTDIVMSELLFEPGIIICELVWLILELRFNTIDRTGGSSILPIHLSIKYWHSQYNYSSRYQDYILEQEVGNDMILDRN